MKFLSKFKFSRDFIFNKFSLSWAEDKYERIEAFIDKNETLLDLGAGKCALSYKLKKEGFEVTPVDVQDLSFHPEIKPLIYDGQHLPFADDSFDTVLLLTVLHHIPDPELVLKEALRVGRKVIVIEDVYNSQLQKYLTYFTDSLFNFEFVGHPHTNKKDQEWKKLFKKLNLELRAEREDQVLKFYTQKTYYLIKEA
ncbi:MAG: class I SAM-dependent methyltransferase [Halanaerobium sp.]